MKTYWNDWGNWYFCFDCSRYMKQVFHSAIFQNKRKKKGKESIHTNLSTTQNMLDNHHPPPFNLIFKGVIHQQCSLVWPQLWSFKELNWLYNLWLFLPIISYGDNLFIDTTLVYFRIERLNFGISLKKNLTNYNSTSFSLDNDFCVKTKT